jgi:hypothetical protein
MTLRFENPRAKGRWLSLGLVVATTMLLVAGVALAVLPGTTFEGNDGNLLRNGAAGSFTDWCNDSISSTAACSAGKTAPNLVVQNDRPSGSGDNAFGQGAKEDISNPTVVSGSIPPNKSDLTRFLVANEKIGANTFLYLGWERSNVLGSANMDFELNQSSTLGGNNTTPIRTQGDLLVTFDFTNGGGNPVLGMLMWLDAAPNTKDDCFSNNNLPCWGMPHNNTLDNLDSLNDNRLNLSTAGFAEGQVNTTNVIEPLGLDAPRTLPALTFGEASINLTLALPDVFGPNPTSCESLGSAFLKSRSAASFPAELKDFIAPASISVSNCGKIVITKTAVGGDNTFSYDTTGGLPGVDSNGEFTIATALGTGSKTFNSVLGGKQYTVDELSLPAHWSFTSLECTDSGGASHSISGDIATINMTSGGEVDCTYTNTHDLASPTIATLLSDDNIDVGDSIHDSSTLTSATADAGGSVTYTVYTDNACTLNARSAGTKTVTGGVVPDSDSLQFNTAGDFYWQAVYTGDVNNHGATSTCTEEHLIVKAKPTIATTLSSETVIIGGSIHDSSTLTGATATAGGTVTYRVYTNSTCTTLAAVGTDINPAQPSAVTVTNHIVPDSANVTFLHAGDFYWQASYSGDAYNNSAISTCTDEHLVVTKNAPGISTAQSLVPDDTATISGATSNAGGTITFSLYGPSDATCSGTAAFTETVNVSGNGDYNTTNRTDASPFVASTAGTWRWKVVYSGDANNDGKTSACGVERFVITNS